MNTVTARRVKLAVALVAYIGSIILANVLVQTFGLVSIGFGLLVPAGTFAAGAALLLRDAVQTYGRQWMVLVAILAGAILSVVMSNPAIALASGMAFLVSELVDWGVFSPLRYRNLALAVLVSSLVSAPVDTIMFLWLAGLGLSWEAVLGQVIVKTALALIVAVIIALVHKENHGSESREPGLMAKS
jgi:uncharacterized PurR-regulated membrane protein YhhQ (DUF165 family)